MLDILHYIFKLFKAPHRIMSFLINKHCYGKFCWHTLVENPLRANYKQNIFLDNNVSIHHKSWIEANPLTGEDICRIVIKAGTTIGDYNHIYATNEIYIEENVLTANFVYISDNAHGYENIVTPIKQQPIIQKKKVRIGEGSWLGEHVCVIGANIGKHCVIGANSVVTKDIPDFSVAVGSPAKIIKRYNFNTQQWE